MSLGNNSAEEEKLNRIGGICRARQGGWQFSRGLVKKASEKKIGKKGKKIQVTQRFTVNPLVYNNSDFFAFMTYINVHIRYI